jgi:hypothetical protein
MEFCVRVIRRGWCGRLTGALLIAMQFAEPQYQKQHHAKCFAEFRKENVH